MKKIYFTTEMRTWRQFIEKRRLKGIVEIRSFPDGETYVCWIVDVKDKKVFLSLYPHLQILQHTLLAKTAEFGAKSICLLRLI
jgi:ribose-phosphate pyrophosphokinase